MEIYSKNLKLAEKIGDKQGVGITLFHIGVILSWKGNHDKSFHYFTRSLKLFEELDDKFWMGVVYNGMGAMYFFDQGIYSNSIADGASYWNRIPPSTSYGGESRFFMKLSAQLVSINTKIESKIIFLAIIFFI